jgi:segregation and condensation protein A
MAGSGDYLVDLDTFRGPLDLLLYLVKREEVDVLDIPIAHIAEQFKRYLDLMAMVDVERAGDFLVMASTLMEIKSKMLLPRPEASGQEAEEDPRRELVRQLIQYKRFKEAAAELERLAERQAQRLARAAAAEPARKPGTALQPIELWDLVSAFGRLMRETLAAQPHAIVVDHTPQHVYMEAVLETLRQQGRVAFSALFAPPHNRSRLVGLFLAVLELMRRFQVLASQEGPFGEIWVWLAPAPPEGEAPPPESPSSGVP